MSTDARRTGLFSGAERRDLVRDGFALVSSAHLAAVCGVLTSFVMRAAVEPALVGVWSMVRTVLEYAQYSSLGVNRAAGRDLAIAAGAMQSAQQDRLKHVAMTVELCTGSIVALGLLGVGAYQAYHGSLTWSLACVVAAMLAVIGRYHAFSLTVLRSHKKFPVLARARVVGSLLDLAFMAGGSYCFGFYGLVLGAVLAQASNAAFVRMAGGLVFKPVADRRLVGELAHAGWPMAADALALAALRSLDRVVILFLLPNGEEQLGWYSVAMILGAWAFDQSNLVANVIYPRLGESLGRSRDEGVVLSMGLRVAEWIGLAMVLCAALLLTVGAGAVDWLLPKYRPGLAAAGGMVAAASLLGISMPLRYALITLGRSITMLFGTCLCVYAALCGNLWLLWRGGAGEAMVLGRVAWVSAGAAALCLILLLVQCVYRHRALVPLAVRVALTAGYAAVGIALWQHATPHRWIHGIALLLWILYPACALAQQVQWRELTIRVVRDGSADPFDRV